MAEALNFESPPPPGAGALDSLLFRDDGALLRAVLDALPARVMVLDRDERCVYVNHEFFAFTGLHPRQVLGRHIADVIGHDTYATYVPARERLRRGEPVRWEGWTHLAGQGRRYMREHLVPYGNEGCVDVAPEAIVVMSRDLTELKQHEAELQQGELQQKVHELTIDIGRVLHANTTTLIMGQQTLDAVEEVLRGAPFDLIGDAQPVPGQNDEVLLGAAAYLAEAIERLLEAADEERRLKALPAAKWQLLAARADFLRNVATTVPLSEMRLPVLRKAAHQVADICREAQPKALSRESVKRDFDLGGVTQAIIEALKPLGIVPAGTSVAEMEASLRLARSVVERGHAGLTSLVRADDRADRWRSLLIILIGAPVATGLLTYLISLMTQAQIARVSTIVTGAAGFLVAAARWIRQQAEWLAEQQEKVEEGQKLYDAAISAGLAEQAAQIANKEQELALARQDYLLAQQRAEQARLQKEAASAELAAATTPRLLGRFVQDRAESPACIACF